MPSNFDPQWLDLLNLGVAYVLAFPIGLDREREEHSAGVRTFPIVAMACCGLTMLAKSLGGGPDVYSRVLQGLVTGIGFVGGGAILKDRGMVSGTATAASVWSTAIVGAAVGMGAYHIAVGLTVFNFISLVFARRLTKRIAPPLDGSNPRPEE